MNFREFETMLLASNSSRTLLFRTYKGYVPIERTKDEQS